MDIFKVEVVRKAMLEKLGTVIKFIEKNILTTRFLI